MRKAFIETIVDLARRDKRVLLLTGDLGFGVLETFANEFPDRFFNVGVAEQNMVGLATGLAREGHVPFVYSMGTFSALRPYEVIRNGPILHRLNVRIVGVGGGFDYGTAGSTHHSLEDLAVLRAQPGIRVFSPADSAQARAIINNTCFTDGPIYYRLSKDERPDIPELKGSFAADRVNVLEEGKDVCFVSTGRITEEVLAAARALREKNISAAVITVPCLNPAPADDLKKKLSSFSSVVAVETHFIQGGLGSLVAEVIADNKLGARLLRMGVRDSGRPEGGDAAYLNGLHDLSKDGLVKAAADFLKKTA
jgi:transketolase